MRENLVLEPRYVTVCRYPLKLAMAASNRARQPHKSGITFPCRDIVPHRTTLQSHPSFPQRSRSDLPAAATVAGMQLLQCDSPVHQPPETTGGRTEPKLKRRKQAASYFHHSPSAVTGCTGQRIEVKADSSSLTAQSRSSISSRYSGQHHPDGHI